VGAATHHWDPMEGLPTQAPARLDSIDSGRDIWKVFMCVSKVNKKQWYLVILASSVSKKLRRSSNRRRFLR
jgi:hypothetical protein